MIPVILSGGSGTRLWPMSRSTYPKQFLPLVATRVKRIPMYSTHRFLISHVSELILWPHRDMRTESMSPGLFPAI